MEKGKWSELHVGVFVAVGLFVLMGSIILIGGDRFMFSTRYELKIKFDQVQGINRGSIVSLAGVKVGNVKDIIFDDGAMSLLVILDLNSEFQPRITEGTVASVKTQGALGDKYIYLVPGSLANSPIQPGEFITAEANTDFLDVISEKGDDIAKIGDVINELDQLLKNLNHNGRSALFMENLASSSQNLNKLLIETRKTVAELKGDKKDKKSLKDAVTHLSSILEKIDKGQGTMGALINNPELHDRLLGVLGESPRNKYLKPLIRGTIQKAEKAK